MVHIRDGLARRAAGRVLARIDSLPLYQRVLPRRYIALGYHVVSADPLPHVRHLYPYKTPEQFEADLRWLGTRFRFLSYEETWESSERGRRMGVLVTFDDGLAECYSVVRPILLKLGVPCVFFLTSSFIDNRALFWRSKISLCIDAARALDPAGLYALLARAGEAAGGPLSSADAFARWMRGLQQDREALIDQMCEAAGVDTARFLRERRPFLTAGEIRTLAADGFALGGHTITHPRLGALRDESRIETEIVESCRVAGALAESEDVPFAFPFGGDGVDRDFLWRLLDRHPFLGTLYDMRGVRDEGHVVHRLGADAPPADGSSGSNLGAAIRGAYRSELRNPDAFWFMEPPRPRVKMSFRRVEQR